MANTTKFVALAHAKHQHLDSLTPIRLPCPQTGQSTLYLHDNANRHLFELQRVTGVGRKTSWLIDNTLYKDGTMRHITHIDPLFIALPLLEQAQKVESNFRTLDDIFSMNDTTAQYLLQLDGFQAQLAHLCDTQEIASDVHVYRLNDTKALAWLQKKVDQLVPSFGTVALLASLTAEDAEKALTEQEKTDLYRQEAVYLLSRYLSEAWFSALLKHLGLKEIEVDQEMGDITNYFTESVSAYTRPSKTSKTAEGTAAKKKREPEVPRSLRNVNTRGMSSLSSYFQKKT